MTTSDLDPDALNAATAAVLDRFSGGSSGLDDMAEAIARDHAIAAIRAYLAAREPGVTGKGEGE